VLSGGGSGRSGRRWALIAVCVCALAGMVFVPW